MSAVRPDVAAERDIRAILGDLIGERRRLEHDGAPAIVLEANRLAITYWQERLAGIDEKRGYTGRRSRM